MIYGIWTFCAALLAFIISAVTGKFLIPYLRKLHFGQTILEEGPKWHKGKQGTPTMGGIMFIVAIVVVTMISTVIYAFTGADLVNSFFADIPRECMFIFCGLGLAVANGFIGFIDDYIKVVKSVTSVLQPRIFLLYYCRRCNRGYRKLGKPYRRY